MVWIRTLLAVFMCGAIAGVAGCGSSSSSSSTAQASAGSATAPSTTSSTTSASSGAAQSSTSKGGGGSRHRQGSQSSGGVAAGGGSSSGSGANGGAGSGSSGGSGSDSTGGSGSSGGSDSSEGSDSSGGSGSTGGSGSSGGSASTGSYGSLASFGHPANGDDKTAVLAAFHSYLAAIANGDWAAACARLSAPVKDQLTKLLARAHGIPGHGCTAALGALLGHTSQALRQQQAASSVVAVRTDGDHAFVLYSSPQFPHATLSMIRESGRWTAGVISGAGVG